jgi:hypothetical protein
VLLRIASCKIWHHAVPRFKGRSSRTHLRSTAWPPCCPTPAIESALHLGTKEAFIRAEPGACSAVSSHGIITQRSNWHAEACMQYCTLPFDPRRSIESFRKPALSVDSHPRPEYRVRTRPTNCRNALCPVPWTTHWCALPRCLCSTGSLLPSDLKHANGLLLRWWMVHAAAREGDMSQECCCSMSSHNQKLLFSLDSPALFTPHRF